MYQLLTITQNSMSERALPEADLRALSWLRRAVGNMTTRCGFWSEALSRFPDAPRSWLRTAEVMIELRRFAEAEVLLEEAVSRFPDHFWLARTRARVARGLNDDVEAYTRCRALRLAFPDNPASHADFAHLLLDLKQLAAAEAEAKASLALFPNSPWLQHMYARCADEAGATAVAAGRWADLLAGHPYHEPAYAAAVRALVRMERHDEAAGIAREGLRLFPTSSATGDVWAEAARVTDADRHRSVRVRSGRGSLDRSHDRGTLGSMGGGRGPLGLVAGAGTCARDRICRRCPCPASFGTYGGSRDRVGESQARSAGRRRRAGGMGRCCHPACIL